VFTDAATLTDGPSFFASERVPQALLAALRPRKFKTSPPFKPWRLPASTSPYLPVRFQAST
jgi:hypothetical protein